MKYFLLNSKRFIKENEKRFKIKDKEKDLINIQHTDGSVKVQIEKQTVDKDNELVCLGVNTSHSRD